MQFHVRIFFWFIWFHEFFCLDFFKFSAPLCICLYYFSNFTPTVLAVEKHTIEKDIAAYIKKEYEKKYAPSFHCIVGKDYGCFITHESGHFIYINVDRYGILLFKSGQTQWKKTNLEIFLTFFQNYYTTI